jgi:hypothetical protein
MSRILDPSFVYTSAAQTDIRRTFERVRRELEQRRDATTTFVCHAPSCLFAGDPIAETDVLCGCELHPQLGNFLRRRD